jgi:hypothetical protein
MSRTSAAPAIALFAAWTCVALAGGGAARAQGAAPVRRLTVPQLEDRLVGLVERSFVRAADAMPESKYAFVPTAGEFKGVRSFGNMVKHVALSNYGMAAALLKEAPPVNLDVESERTAKADILKFLTGSFAYLHKAVGRIDGKNLTEPVQSPDSPTPLARLEVADRALWHCFDHYGQMVEYLRMNGIVPPASRQ